MLRPHPLLRPSADGVTAKARSYSAPHLAVVQARKLRDKLASRYDETTSYTMPGKDGITAGPDQSEIYDDTAVIAVPEFASRLQQGVIPNFSRWASHMVGIMIEDENEKLRVSQALEKVDNYLFELINSSNFQIEANEAFMDLSLGTMGFRVDESSTRSPFNCRAIPLRGLLFCIGADGMPDPIMEERKVTLSTIEMDYPDATLPVKMTDEGVQDPWKEHHVIECWQRDWSEPAAWRYRMTLHCPEHDNHIAVTRIEQGEGCNPYFVSRWSKSSGEAWGRGPAFNCLPSMRTVNFAMRSLMDHADIALAGIWSVEDDGVINTDTVKLEPGTLVPRAMGSQPLQNVAPGANFDIQQFMLNEMRANIKKALYNEQLGNPNKTPMSATEVQQRMAELARAIGAPFGRIILEFVYPFIARATFILVKRGMIQMPEVDGKRIKLTPTSPLSQSQRFEDIDAIDKWTGLIAGRFGVEMLNIVVDGNEAAKELGVAFQVPKKLIRSPEQQQRMIQMIQQAQQGAQPSGADQSEQGGGEAPPT